MRVLYGVVGEGMGHAMRSIVVIEHLLSQGHEVRVAVSGRAHAFLTDRLAGREGASVVEVLGFTLAYRLNEMDLRASIVENLRKGPRALSVGLAAYRELVESGFEAELVMTDFETWATLYAHWNRLPLVCLDNQHVLTRCHQPHEVLPDETGASRVARAAVRAKTPGCGHYLVTSFFFPEVRRPRTTLLPPVLRGEVVGVERSPEDHVLVYQTATSNAEQLVTTLRSLPHEFRVYGLRREEDLGNVQLRDFDAERFLDDLRTARAAVAGGGFTFLSEAVHLRVPVLSVPVEGQFEQELNARWLEHLGYGRWCRHVGASDVSAFLEDLEPFARALLTHPSQGNEATLACVDEIVASVARGEGVPERLDAAPTLG